MYDFCFFFLHVKRNNGRATTLENKWCIIMRRLDGIEVSRMCSCDCPTLDTKNFCNIPREISLYTYTTHFIRSLLLLMHYASADSLGGEYLAIVYTRRIYKAGTRIAYKKQYTQILQR